jgi:hypothetical protein
MCKIYVYKQTNKHIYIYIQKDAVGGLAAALNKTLNEVKEKDKLPDDEPLYTNAARLMLLLKEEQALDNAPTDLFKSSASVTSASTGRTSEADRLKKKQEEEDAVGDISKWYTPECCWWIDLETIHGGDPTALPVLRKLAKTLQVIFFFLQFSLFFSPLSPHISYLCLSISQPY